MTSFSRNQAKTQLFVSSDASMLLADEIIDYLEESEVVASHEVFFIGGAFLIRLEPEIDPEEAAVLLKLRFENVEVEMRRPR